MRKVLTAIFAIVGAIVAFVTKEAGVSSGLGAALAGLGVALTFILFEARADIKAVLEGLKQTNKASDPAFWTGLISVILLEVSAIFGLDIPVTIITPVLMAVIPLLIKLFRKERAA